MGGTPQQAAQPQRSQAQRPTQRPQTTQRRPSAAAGGRKWIAARSISVPGTQQGDPVVMSKVQGGDGWEYMDQQGNTGVLPGASIMQAVKSERDAQGNTQSSMDPSELFALMGAELQGHGGNVGGIDQPESDDHDDSPMIKSGNYGGNRPSPEEVRLPPEHMTQYNQAIEDKFINGVDESTGRPTNIMIDALAGTGKTTMLKHLSSFIKPGEKWLYLVFNKKNQLESQSEFPKGVEVLTTHSFLGKLLQGAGKNVGGGTELPPRGQKWKKMWQVADNKAIMPLEWPESIHSRVDRQGRMRSPFHWKAKNLSTKLASLAKAYAIMPDSPTIEQELMKIVESSGMDMDLSTENKIQDRDYTPDIIAKTIELLHLTLPGGTDDLDQRFANYRDQDDTLWYAAIYADQINWNLGYDVVLMDEVQDFNMCQLVMANKLREAGARVVGVGDPNQAMYLFRGADSAAFEKLKEIIGGGESESLPINFRSGGNIIDWVTKNTHVTNLQAAPHLQGQGEVWAEGGTHPPVGYQDFMSMVGEEFATNGGSSHPTAMICRSNAPLAHAALSFLKSGIDFEIIGVDLSKDLTDLIKKVTWQKPEDYRKYPIQDFALTLSEYQEELERKWNNLVSKKDELKDIRSYMGVLMAVLGHLEENGFREDEKSQPMKSPQDLIDFLMRKLGGLDPENSMNDAKKLKEKDPNSYVTLTTAHKAKGLEWDRTFLMKPKEYDPESDKIKNEEQAQQERNAWYVAATRGRNILMVSADDEPGSKSNDDENALGGIDFMRLF